MKYESKAVLSISYSGLSEGYRRVIRDYQGLLGFIRVIRVTLHGVTVT